MELNSSRNIIIIMFVMSYHLLSSIWIGSRQCEVQNTHHVSNICVLNTYSIMYGRMAALWMSLSEENTHGARNIRILLFIKYIYIYASYIGTFDDFAFSALVSIAINVQVWKTTIVVNWSKGLPCLITRK